MSGQPPLEIERKYLIEMPDHALLSTFEAAEATEITQTYLKPDETGMMRRVRKRGSECRGWQYTYTRKKTVGFGKRIEIEDEVAEARYQALLQEAHPTMHPISKVRWTFRYQGQFFELDVYTISDTLATLEIELPDIDTPVTLPPQLHVLADVTGKRGFSNFALSQNGAFPTEIA